MQRTKRNSKWIKDLNDRLKTTQILDKTMGSKISDISHRNIFSAISTQARETQEKINKWDYSKGNHEENEKTTHWMGEHIHWYI